MGVPTNADPPHDAIGEDGAAHDIAADLDITDTYAGWAQLPPADFEGDGVFDCSSTRVLCANGGGAQPPDGWYILASVGVASALEFGIERAGQVAVVIDRVDIPNSPPQADGFGGADLVAYADLNGDGSLEMIEWKKGGWQLAPRRASEARILVDGQTVVFAIPALREEQPKVRFLTFERIPPDQAGAGVLDAAPSADSFFDVYYEITLP